MIWFYLKWLQYLELTVYNEHLGRMIANDQIRNTSPNNLMDNTKEKNIKKEYRFLHTDQGAIFKGRPTWNNQKLQK